MNSTTFQEYLLEQSPIDIAGKKALMDIKEKVFSDSLQSWLDSLPNKNLKRRLGDVKASLQILCDGVGIK